MEGIEIKIINKIRHEFIPNEFRVEITIEPKLFVPEDVRDKIISGKEVYDFDGEYAEELNEFLELLELIEDISKISKAFNKEMVWCIKIEREVVLIYYNFYSEKLQKKFVENMKRLL